MLSKLRKFLSESRDELRHVNWPTRAEAMRLTTIVVGMSLALAVFLGTFDALFQYLLKTFVIQ